MIAVDGWIEAAGVPARMILQVHDELVFEVEEAALEAFCKEVRTHMSAAAELSVPLLVEVGSGRNWDEAH